MYIPDIDDVRRAADRLSHVTEQTLFHKSITYSDRFGADIFFKREDLQRIRSYKIRGAYNKMSSLSAEDKQRGVVCASAGNHAQGVSYSCQYLKIKGIIYMPETTPRQKINQVAMFGGDYVEIILEGDTFDDAYALAVTHCKNTQKIFIHPFDDEKIIEGQATVGLEILSQVSKPLDYIIMPVGGGGLLAGVSAIYHKLSPDTKIIGVEPLGASSMKTSIDRGENTMLDKLDRFVDGAAVRRVGDRNFEICRRYIHQMITIPEGHICQIILDLYNKDAIVVEPAGALSVAALEYISDDILGKRVACVISGSNNDIARMSEIKERALLYGKLKHYFIIKFPQRAGALREFVEDILGPKDDITYFEYQKKHSKENGPAIVGIQLKSSNDLQPLIDRMTQSKFFGEYLNEKPDLMSFLI